MLIFFLPHSSSCIQYRILSTSWVDEQWVDILPIWIDLTPNSEQVSQALRKTEWILDPNTLLFCRNNSFPFLSRSLCILRIRYLWNRDMRARILLRFLHIIEVYLSLKLRIRVYSKKLNGILRCSPNKWAICSCILLTLSVIELLAFIKKNNEKVIHSSFTVFIHTQISMKHLSLQVCARYRVG